MTHVCVSQCTGENFCAVFLIPNYRCNVLHVMKQFRNCMSCMSMFNGLCSATVTTSTSGCSIRGPSAPVSIFVMRNCHVSHFRFLFSKIQIWLMVYIGNFLPPSLEEKKCAMRKMGAEINKTQQRERGMRSQRPVLTRMCSLL